MTKHIFINPKMFKRIDRKVKAILKAYPDAFIQEWQLRRMVNVVESGMATETSYQDDGLTIDCWSRSSDPHSAYQGFYRLEKAQWADTMIDTVRNQYDKGMSEEEINDGLMQYSSHRGYFVFEPVARVWGYKVTQFCDSEAEAECLLSCERGKKGFKRGMVQDHKWAGWMVKFETTRKPRTDFSQMHRERIDK